MNSPLTPLAVLLNPRVQTVWAAREVGARTLMVGPDLTAPGMNRVLAEADQAIEADWRDYRELTAALEHLAGRAQVSVFGFEDATALAASRVNWCLRLPGSSPLSVAVLSDSLALRERVNALTATPVRFAMCTRAELTRAACQVGFPCAVRPRAYPTADQAPLPRDMPVLHDVIDAERLAAHLPEVELVIEEYLDGPRVTAEAFSYHGSHTVHRVTPVRTRRIDGQTTTGERRPDRLDRPDRLEESVGPELHRLVSDTLDAADFLVGPSQTTIALTARGPRLVAARACPRPDSTLPGFSIAALLELAPPAHRAQAS